MLTIRREQIEAFRELMLDQFADRMRKYLVTALPEQTRAVPEEMLRARIRSGIEKAESHGLTTEWDICRFLQYVIRFGADFDSDPATGWAAEILETPAATGSAKMDRIDNYFYYVLRGSTNALSSGRM